VAEVIPLALEFMYPARLWAMILIPAIAVIYLLLASRSQSRRRRPRNRLQLVLPKDAAWKRHGAVLLALLSIASLIIAWAVPKDYANQPRDRATVVVAIDVSWSMEAEDIEPSRLEAAKDSANQFIGTLPPGFNVAVVTFAGTARLVVPPTVDRGAAERAIQALELAPSTAIGEGIYSSLDSLALVPPDPNDPDKGAPAVIVLLSDGATNMGRTSAGAAQTAADRGVPVHTIAYGTDTGYVVDDAGRRQRVPVDHYELSEIARISGGTKYAAESAGELSQTYEAISQSVGYERVPTEVTDRYAGLALIFAVLAALGVISLGARWP
jgi:Ca-activated chloride channel homolog